MANTSHVVIFSDPARLACLNCGAVDMIQLPIPTRAFVARADAFRDRHAGCVKPVPQTRGDNA